MTQEGIDIVKALTVKRKIGRTLFGKKGIYYYRTKMYDLIGYSRCSLVKTDDTEGLRYLSLYFGEKHALFPLISLHNYMPEKGLSASVVTFGRGRHIR